MNNFFHISSIRLLSVSTTVIAAALVASLFVYSADPIKDDKSDFENNFTGNYAIHALPIPKEMSFANEPVPLNKTYVRESLDREILVNTYWQSQTLLLIKRSHRYFPIIEPILKAEEVPDDFKYLALIESGLMPRVVSPAGAAGIWQFMPDAAKDYGLEINKEVDERYHLEKSTIAACKFLKKAHSQYGSWALAAAAYNAGPSGINRHLTKQKSNNYYDLLLGEETGRYLYRILAIKRIIEEPQSYGFHLNAEDFYRPIDNFEIEISGSIANFADFAIEQGITYRELKDLNPWLRETYLTNSEGKTYKLKLPKPGAFIAD